MMDVLSIALVCGAVAAAGWFAAQRRRSAGPVDDVVGGAVVMTVFAACVLITLGVTSALALVGAVAVATLISTGIRLRRAFVR